MTSLPYCTQLTASQVYNLTDAWKGIRESSPVDYLLLPYCMLTSHKALYDWPD